MIDREALIRGLPKEVNDDQDRALMELLSFAEREARFEGVIDTESWLDHCKEHYVIIKRTEQKVKI